MANIFTEKKHHKPSLKDAFVSTFHEKYQYQDFLNTHAKDEVKHFFYHEKIIYSPTEKLRKYSRFLNTFIFNHATINGNILHSYRKEKNTYSAVKEHIGNKYFLKTDINDFFYSISEKDICTVIEKNLKNAPISDLNKHFDSIFNLISIEKSVPIGLGTSPNITNSVLLEFDNKLETYCKKNKLKYTRYADDIIISSNTKETIKETSEIISFYLKEHSHSRLELNKKKTKLIYPGDKVKLLGLVILPSGKITVDSDLKKEIEVLLHFFTTDKIKYYDYLKNNFEGNMSSISGKLNYISSIDTDFIVKLRMKYGNFAVDNFFSVGEG